MRAMRTQRFRALVADAPGGRATIAVPFDPDELWGAKDVHHVNGTVKGTRVRVTLPPEDPQRSDMAEDVAAPLAANPAAGAFFDTLAQFYRKAYLRWIDATTRRPEIRAARIEEVVDLLAAGVKERPR